MQLFRTKFGKICQWTQKIKDAVVYGWGRQIFPKWPKENKNSLNFFFFFFFFFELARGHDGVKSCLTELRLKLETFLIKDEIASNNASCQVNV